MVCDNVLRLVINIFMKSNRFLVLLLTCVAVTAYSQSPDQLFQQAQQAYDQGEYQQAIQLYNQILEQNRESAAVHYNLGNAYFRTDRLGEAILHYEKAELLNPRDEDIRHNLEVAQMQIQDRITAPEPSVFMRVFNGIKYLFNLNELAWLTGIMVFIGSLLFAAWRFLHWTRFRKLIGGILGIWVLLLVLEVPMLVSRTLEARQQTYGIVLSEEVSVRSAPQEMSTEVFIIHEGTKVEIEDSQYEWYRIRLLDNKEGWIYSGSVGII